MLAFYLLFNLSSSPLYRVSMQIPQTHREQLRGARLPSPGQIFGKI